MIVVVVAKDVEQHAPEEFREILLQGIGRAKSSYGAGDVAVAALCHFLRTGKSHGRDEVAAEWMYMIAKPVESLNQKNITSSDGDNLAAGHPDAASSSQMHGR